MKLSPFTIVVFVVAIILIFTFTYGYKSVVSRIQNYNDGVNQIHMGSILLKKNTDWLLSLYKNNNGEVLLYGFFPINHDSDSDNEYIEKAISFASFDNLNNSGEIDFLLLNDSTNKVISNIINSGSEKYLISKEFGFDLIRLNNKSSLIYAASTKDNVLLIIRNARFSDIAIDFNLVNN